MIDLILLAAGPARRFGQEQLLGEAGGVPLYRRAFEAARQAADAMMGLRVLVVTAKGVLDAPIREFGFNKVVVPENRPLSASVAAGARAARSGASRCFLPCDHAGFNGELLTGFLQGYILSGRTLETERHCYPEDLFHYCVGLDSLVLDRGRSIPKDLPDQVEEHLKRPSCCGVKLYPGYNRLWLTDPVYDPIYRLAERYDKPVAVHTGLTAYARVHLKYSHPLALDEAAADHPRTRFVMCHFGNPFLQEAAAVLGKNPNVCADLSGLLEGRVELDRYFEEQAGYAGLLKSWLASTCAWDRILYGTDWPIVNLGEYIGFIQRLAPERHWEAVFFENANRVYGLGL